MTRKTSQLRCFSNCGGTWAQREWLTVRYCRGSWRQRPTWRATPLAHSDAIAACSQLFQRTELQQIPSNLPNPVSTSARAAPIALAVRALPLIDQQLILATALEELSLEQAAAALGLSYGAAKTRLSRARRPLASASTGLDPLGAIS